MISLLECIGVCKENQIDNLASSKLEANINKLLTKWLVVCAIDLKLLSELLNLFVLEKKCRRQQFFYNRINFETLNFLILKP